RITPAHGAQDREDRRFLPLQRDYHHLRKHLPSSQLGSPCPQGELGRGEQAGRFASAAATLALERFGPFRATERDVEDTLI
ncbi:MAG: hypothetical protein O7C67_18080, partial [Gammaproteobacteria bacterium]|nr:hypothetical protein [Gammaproteobacteria bacterium]